MLTYGSEIKPFQAVNVKDTKSSSINDIIKELFYASHCKMTSHFHCCSVLWISASQFQQQCGHEQALWSVDSARRPVKVWAHHEYIFTLLKYQGSCSHSLCTPTNGVCRCVCVSRCTKHFVLRDYPSFCSGLPELLTQRLLTEKLCIRIDCVEISVCVCWSLNFILFHKKKSLQLHIVPQLVFDTIMLLFFHPLFLKTTRKTLYFCFAVDL